MPRPVVLEIRKRRGKIWLRTRSKASRGAKRTEGEAIVEEGEVFSFLSSDAGLRALALPPKRVPVTE